MADGPKIEDFKPAITDGARFSTGATPEMVRVVAEFLHAWDHEEWEAPEGDLDNVYDILAKQIVRSVLQIDSHRGNRRI